MSRCGAAGQRVANRDNPTAAHRRGLDAKGVARPEPPLSLFRPHALRQPAGAFQKGKYVQCANETEAARSATLRTRRPLL